MNVLRMRVKRSLCGISGFRTRIGQAKSNAFRQIFTKSPKSNPSRTLNQQLLGAIIVGSFSATVWWFSSSQKIYLAAEAPYHGHVQSHGLNRDERLEPHVASMMPLQSSGQNFSPHLADIYAKTEFEPLDLTKLPIEEAVLTSAPDVPPPISRDYSVVLKVHLTTTIKKAQLTGAYKYEQWTFNGQVPGPFIRARVGDVVELRLTNKDESGMPHNIDCHAFLGPGGGSAVTTTDENQTKTARFQLLCPANGR